MTLAALGDFFIYIVPYLFDRISGSEPVYTTDTIYISTIAYLSCYMMQLSMLPGRGSADFSDLTESTGLCSIQRHGGQVIDDFVLRLFLTLFGSNFFNE